MTKYAKADVYLAACARMALLKWNTTGPITIRAHARAPLTWQRATLAAYLTRFSENRLHCGFTRTSGRLIDICIVTATPPVYWSRLDYSAALSRLSCESGIRRAILRAGRRLRHDARMNSLR